MNNVGNETALTFANHYVDEVVKTVLSLKTIPTNAIAFAKIGAAIFLERKKIITQDSFIDNNMMAFIPNQDFLNSKFAYFQFLAQSFGELIEATALPSLGSKVLRQKTCHQNRCHAAAAFRPPAPARIRLERSYEKQRAGGNPRRLGNGETREGSKNQAWKKSKRSCF